MSGKKQRNFDWLIWLWFVFLAIFFTRPLILKMENEVAGEIGDNIYFIWMIGWVKKALFTLGVDPMNVWFLNYPEGWNMAHTEITPAQLAFGQIFSFLGSETFAYNAVMLLSLSFSRLSARRSPLRCLLARIRFLSRMRKSPTTVSPSAIS